MIKHLKSLGVLLIAVLLFAVINGCAAKIFSEDTDITDMMDFFKEWDVHTPTA